MADNALERTPPHDEEAEKSVLGAMLLSKDAIAAVAPMIVGTDYYYPAHETVHDTIIDMFSAGQPADAVTVAAQLNRDGKLGQIGGAAFLHSLLASVPNAASATHYARIVRECSQLRRLVDAGTRIVQLGYATDGGDVDDIVNMAQAEIYAVTQKRQSEDYKRIGDIVERTVEQVEAMQDDKRPDTAVPTGFADLDHIIHGLQGGQMIIVAARPAMGKSTFALDVCRSASLRNNIPAVIFSLEMSAPEITMRMLSAESGVYLEKMRSGKMQDQDWTAMVGVISRAKEAPLYIDDSPNMTMPEIAAKARRLKQQQGLGLIVVDYLQLMTSAKQVESRQQEVSAFSRSLKLLAKEIDVPVIAVAQLNRGPEQRTDHKPMLSDLRESGSLEQDADLVLLLSRPEAYDSQERPGEADVIIAKHRNGRTGTVVLAFQGQMSRFNNFAKE